MATTTAVVEKSLESVAVELNYIATAPPSVERAESAGKILARGVSTLSGSQSLKWSSVLEQLVNSVKLVLFQFDLEEQIGRGQIGHGRQGNEDSSVVHGNVSAPVPMPTPTVCRQGLELFLAVTKVLRGKESFPLFQTLLLKDYPFRFHFLDLLHPSVFNSLSLDPYLLLKLVKVLLLNSRTALGHAEGAPSSTRARPFVSSSQAIGGTLEELGLCLISLYGASIPVMRLRDPYQQLITFLEICPLPKLSAGFLKRLNAFVLQGLRRSRSHGDGDGHNSEERDFFLALLFEVVKKPSPHARILVRTCLGNDEGGHSNHNQSLIEESLVTLETAPPIPPLDRPRLRPLLDLEILTVLAESYLAEPKMVGVAMRCLEIVMELLGKMGAITRRPRGHPQPQRGAGVSQPTPYPYAYDVDKIGKLVRIYNPSRKTLENLGAKAKCGNLAANLDLDQFYIFRQSLQFMEVLVGKAGKMAAVGKEVGDDESVELLIQSVLTNYERLLLQSKTLVETRARFVGQGTFDVLAAMTNGLYSKLSEESQRHCLLTFLYYADVGREVALRVKAGRCLAIYLEFDDVAQAEGAFLLQALGVIEKNLTLRQSETPVLNDDVVTMFGWAFGNFTSVLASYYQGVLVVTATAHGEPDGSDCDHFLGRLRAIVLVILKNSKALHNGYRTLGNIIYWAPLLYFPTIQFNSLLHEAIDILSSQIGVGRDYKARWNAAAALGNILRNSQLLAAKYEDFVPAILKSLSVCMERTESVKEKIHCLNALAKLEHRSYYGAEFGLLWQRLVKLVEAPPRGCGADVVMETRSEELLHKIGGTCSHLIGLMTPEDFTAMDDFLLEHADSVEQLFVKMRDELQVPEQLETLDSAYQHLQGLQKGTAALARLESFALLERLLDPQQHAHGHAHAHA